MVLNIGFLASHKGSNMQAIIDACKSKALEAVPCVIISNNSGSVALQRAVNENIPHYHLSSATHPDEKDLDRAILEAFKKHGVTLICLAGYMKKIGPLLINEYKNRILNIHPALLPKYGGQCMFGNLVHQAVIKAKDKKTGVTIHIVNSEYDKGPIVYQTEVPVMDDDTADILSQRVLKAEHETYVKTLKLISDGVIKLDSLK